MNEWSNLVGYNDSLFQSCSQFCQDSVEMMGEDCDHVHITALCDALGVPTRVECLDQSTSSSGDLTPKHHDFIPMQSSASDAGDPPVPRVTLLYRPGHYDILYPKWSLTGLVCLLSICPMLFVDGFALTIILRVAADCCYIGSESDEGGIISMWCQMNRSWASIYS